MFLKTCIEIFLLCVSCVSYAQMGTRERVVFYNTENLFDTRNDTLTADDDFTPRGKQHWNRERYTRKLLNISKVLNGLGAGKFPLLIGLSEVENRNVVSDLVNKTVLADGNYGIVHTTHRIQGELMLLYSTGKIHFGYCITLSFLST